MDMRYINTVVVSSSIGYQKYCIGTETLNIKLLL